MKTCKRCGIEQPFDNFYKFERMADGYCSNCKKCMAEMKKSWAAKNAERIKIKAKEWRKNNPEKVKQHEKTRRIRYPDRVRNNQLKAAYGITVDEYNRMLREQKGKCKICGRETLGKGDKRRLAVDHDHKTGIVRGLLCTPCNYLIGLANDDFYLLHKASEYLKEFFEYEDQ